MKEQQRFFNTEAEVKNPEESANQLTKKSLKLKNYVSRLDVQINKALNSQNNIMARKKRELVHQLEAIKESTEQERRKFQNMEDDFVKYCESILQKDIQKWNNNHSFFRDLFRSYDLKIKEQKKKNADKKEQLRRITTKVKERLRQIRNIEGGKLNKSISEEDSNLFGSNKKLTYRMSTNYEKSDRQIRIKTQSSLPFLPKNMPKLSGHEYKKSYMQPTKKTRVNSFYSIQESNSLLQMLKWYKSSLKKSQNWFQRMLFQGENFTILENYLQNPQKPLRKKKSETEV